MFSTGNFFMRTNLSTRGLGGLLAVALMAMGAEAYTFHRGFQRGYPRGTLPGATPQASQLTGASTTGGQQSSKTLSRRHVFRLVRDTGGDFAMKAARGEPISVELTEPKGCRWSMPLSSSSYSIVIERGGMAKQRSKGVAGGPETVLVTLRRLAEGSVDVVLNCRRTSADLGEAPVRTVTIRLVSP